VPRLFTAIELPDPIARALTALRGGLQGARWIDPENYHITLRFIGDIDDDVADEAAEILGRIQRESFSLTLSGLDTFGGKKPHSLWTGVASSPELVALQAEQERLLQRIGLKPEARKFTPHVTIARLRGVPASAVAQYMSSRGLFRTAAFPVERFVLYSSRASQGGGPYIVEEAYDLAGDLTGDLIRRG
jgi:2'-5' RNA ligase